MKSLTTDQIQERRRTFRALHESGCFVMPNPWDAGSARYLEEEGFPALATTSSGASFARARPDGGVARDEMLAHIADVVAATSVPVNADYESAHADDPDGVAKNVALCLATGVAGLSVEDRTRDDAAPLYDFGLAVERVRAASAAMAGTGALLTARTECYLTRHPDPFKEAMRRLPAFAEAGADVLFAPGVARPDEIVALVRAVAPRPVNLLVAASMGFRVADVERLGVRRISVGSALCRAAWTGFAAATKRLAGEGSFEGLAGLLPNTELNRLFSGGG